MMNVISSISTTPTQMLTLDLPVGPALVVALAVVVAIALVDQARSLLSRPRPATPTSLRLVHSA